ncbi:MAG: Peptide chain release factor subunit 1 [Candidatus Methanolliviera sp. GoM_oil]|nr:MAG: Peptide chain release factor subunit 1 [Candidatus Methanolliviera sp. GoM_oil]
MKLIKKVLKDNTGKIQLLPQNLDDIWHLKYIIERDDLVFSQTRRDVEGADDKIRPEKREKKKMWLGIEVEEIKFHKFSNRLRISGKIREGAQRSRDKIDLGSYHTLNIEPGTELSIIKEWKKDQLDRIKEAVNASNQPKIVILTVEEGEASVGVVRQYGIDESFKISSSSGKSSGESMRNDFFAEIFAQVSQTLEQDTRIVIAGPGFTKNDLYRYIKGRDQKIADRIILEDVSSIGVSGFQEALRRGVIERIVKESRISKEARYIEILLEEIAKNGLAAYGEKEVERADECGAIETLLILDEYVRGKRELGDTEDQRFSVGKYSICHIDRFLKSVEAKGGRIIVFSSDFEPGKRLEGLGGISAVLRFKI